MKNIRSVLEEGYADKHLTYQIVQNTLVVDDFYRLNEKSRIFQNVKESQRVTMDYIESVEEIKKMGKSCYRKTRIPTELL